MTKPVWLLPYIARARQWGRIADAWVAMGVLRRGDIPENPPLFVYGTLKRGYPLHHWLAGGEDSGSTYLGFAVLRGWTLYSAGRFPLAVPEQGRSIYGEVWQVHPARYALLDRLEGAYDRVPAVALVRGQPTVVQLYQWRGSASRFQHHGVNW